ncbi:MAG: hypothetical protein V7607_6685 [Solirubrobacteraceae bacterium]
MARVVGIEATARTIPTDGPESDGTFEWRDTTAVVARVRAGGEVGIGYTYADASVASLIESKLAPAIEGRDAHAGAQCWEAMHRALRNDGHVGAGAMALSAVDIALHDLRGRLLGVPAHRMLGAARENVPIYASGGFCSCDEEPLSSDDLPGLRELRRRVPAGIVIAAGEYAWSPLEARCMLEARAVDVLQLDVTRCGGITGALMIDALAWTHGVRTSLHCAPAASVHAAVAMRTLLHLEHFHDHVRVEDEVFEGAPIPRGGLLAPTDRPGLGMEARA